jgi:hypothetical protein
MMQPANQPLKFDRSWQDAFGTVLASIEQGSRKRTVIVFASCVLSQLTLEALAGITFQGRIVMAILEHLHGAPLEAVMRDQKPNLVVTLEPEQVGIAMHGPAIQGQARLELASTGLEYTEPGTYPAWKNRDAVGSEPHASNVTASVASNLGLPCLVCNPSDLKTALEHLFPN